MNKLEKIKKSEDLVPGWTYKLGDKSFQQINIFSKQNWSDAVFVGSTDTFCFLSFGEIIPIGSSAFQALLVTTETGLFGWTLALIDPKSKEFQINLVKVDLEES